jgi:DNA-binding MarR family transcriptional regulator
MESRPTSARPTRGQPAELSAMVSELFRHINRRSAGDSLALMGEAGLSMPQLVTLHLLAHASGRSVGEIGSRLRLSPAATSHLVDKLVQAGLVARTEDPNDRRSRLLAITPEGRRLVDRINSERTREVSAVLGRISPQLRRQFADALARVIEELASLPEESP